MATFNSFSALAPYQIWHGAVARAVHGERITMAVIDLDPNLDIAEHQHENEQLGFVIQGRITMTIGGNAKELGEGDTYAIASNIRHSARTGPHGATVVDVFTPIRDDWEKAPRMQPSPGKWPR